MTIVTFKNDFLQTSTISVNKTSAVNSDFIKIG